MSDMSWFRKFIKKTGLNPSTPDLNTSIFSTIPSKEADKSLDYIYSGYATTVSTGTITTTGTVTSVPYVPITTHISAGGGGGGSFGTITFSPPPPPTSIISLSGNNKEIVKIKNNGEVEWADGYKIDEAAEAFGKSLGLGVEIAAGITNRVKLSMRDSVFEDLIAIAKEKGSLTAEDLTYLLQASKIVEKLKGGNE